MRTWHKSILLVAVFNLFLVAGQAPAVGQGWANGCLYRQAITIDHTKVPNTDQSNFPLLISGTYAYLATTANGGNVTNANGYDILFSSDANGVNLLPFEQESYNPSTGAINYWVKVPTLSHTTNTVIYMFYGNSLITTDQSNKTAVWDSNYKGVWHLPNGTSLTANDSTSNSNNGTITGATATSGQIGGAANFSGSGQYVDLGSGSSLSITGNTLTVDAWVKTSESNPSQYERVLVKEVSGNVDPWVVYGFWRNGGTNLVSFGVATGGAGSLASVSSVTSLPMGTWTHLVGTYDGSNLKIYVNGNLDNQASNTGNIASTSLDAVMGWDSDGAEYFNGSLDEVRISNSARSADWIATEYNNQSSPPIFYSVGSATQGTNTVQITLVDPSSANYGDMVAIQGQNFGATQGGGTVALNGTNLVAQEWSNTVIVVPVPLNATSSGYFTVTANGQTAVSQIFTVKALTSGWSDGDIGTASVAGSASYTNGAFTVSSSGVGILSGQTSDWFHFVSQPLSGDGTIVARVVSVQGGYTGYTQAGVMIRETLNPSAAFAYPSYNGGTTYFFYRPSTGAGNASDNAGSATLPYWLKLVRSGNTFTGYTSPDGLSWYQAGSTHTITMAQNVYIGLAVGTGNAGALTSATFDCVSVSSSANPGPVITSVSGTTGAIGSQVTINGTGFGAAQNGSLVLLNNVPVTINSWTNTSIVITIPTGATSGPLLVSVAPTMNDSNAVDFTVTSNPLPVPWLDQDVGLVGIPGNASYSGTTFTVQGGGVGIENTYSTDAFHFVYQPLSGDGSIVARVVNFSSNGNAGIVIRETMDQGATEGSASNCCGLIYFLYRASYGGTNTRGSNVGNYTVPFWVQLVRVGNTFSVYSSTDGVNWSQVDTSQTITMPQNVYIGLFAAQMSNSGLTTATFDNVAVNVGTSPIVTAVSPSLGPVGTVVTIVGSNFGATQGTSTVSFNGVQATSVSSWSSNQIVATVPSGTPAGPGPVTVTVNSITSPGTVAFNAIEPAITSLAPPAAPIGGYVTLAGTGFGPSQASSTVLFNGVTATATSWSNTSITAIVPAGATSGPVSVVEDAVTSNGAQFTVLEALSITGISPGSGPTGSTVTISGTGFGPTQSTSSATFYNTPATITSWSDTQITAVVPSGTSTGPVSVTVAGLTYYGPWLTITSSLQLTDSLGNQTSYTSAIVGGKWVSSSAQGSGCSSCTIRGTISHTYDNKGNTLSRTDENGNTTTYTYDFNSDVLSVTVPINSSTTATTSYTYNSFGEVLTTTDPLGNVITNTYDANGNLLTVTTPAPTSGASASVTQFAYNSLGELTQITDPLNNVTTLTYTSAGLIATIKDAQNNVTTYGYDSHGNRTSVTDALSHQTTFTYDSMDRLTKITYPDSTTTQFAYDYRGRRTSVTDQNGKTTTYAYDDADRLTSVTDAASNVTTYGYDTESNLTSITDANNNTTSFTYDAFGRVTKTTFPSGNFETYSYDSVGNLTGKTDRKNQLITYTYDQLNRLTQKLYPDSTTVNYTYDNDSRLTQVTDPTGTYQFTFDNMGRLTATSTSYAFLTGRTFTTAYSYDAASNRTGFTDPESGSTSYAYDTLNRLQTLTPPAAYGSGNFGFSYDALSRRTQMTRPNGLSSIYAYDNLSRLTSVLHQSGTTTLDGAAYTVDNAGNRTSRTPQPSGTASNFTYDNIYELTGVTQGSSTTESYSYDPVGNRLSSLGVSSYTNNSSNELTSTSNATYTYDYNGNLLTKVVGSNTTGFAWDYESRLTSVTLPGSGGTVSFKYDPFGRRIYKSSSSGTSVYAYDGDNLVEETNSSGTAVARYSQGLNIDEPLAMLRSGAASFFHADGLGSITSLSSASGTIAQTYSFDSFGNQTASSGSLTNWFQYTGREFDTETSLYYYRARYYDPQAGRFLSEDPIGFKGGMDFYSYVHNTAPNVADAFGLQKNKCSWSGGCSDMPLPWLRKPCGSSPCKNKAVADQIHKECNAFSNCVVQELGKNIAEGVVGDPLGALGHVKPPDPNPAHDGSAPIVVPGPEVGIGDLLKVGQAALLKAMQDCFKQHPLAGLDPGFNAVDVGEESTGPTGFQSLINGLLKVLPQPH